MKVLGIAIGILATILFLAWWMEDRETAGGPSVASPDTDATPSGNEGHPSPPDPGGSRASLPRSLTGSVVDASTGRPVAGAQVIENCEDAEREWESRKDGTFELPLDPPGLRRLHVRSDQRYQYFPRHIVCDGSTAPEQGIVFQAYPLDWTELSYVLVDATTKTPLPDYRARFTSDLAEEEPFVIVTDLDGVGSLERPVRPCEYRITPMDHEDLIGKRAPSFSLHAKELSTRPVLDLEVGPTLTLDVDQPTEGLHATIVHRSDAHPSDLCDDRGRFERNDAPVRTDEERIWVRFGILDSVPDEATGWRFFLASRENYRLGFADLPTDFVDSGPLLVRMNPVGALIARVEEEDGSPLVPGAVRTAPVGDVSSFSGPSSVWSSEEQPGCRFWFLEPGPHTLSAWPPGRPKIEQWVAIDADRTKAVRATPPRPEGALRTVVVRATSESSAPVEGTRATIEKLDGSLFSIGGPLEWKEIDGEAMGEFVGRDLPDVPYRVSLWTFGEGPVSPDYAYLSNNNEIAEFVIHDEAPRPTLRFRMVDASTGQPPEGQVRVEVIRGRRIESYAGNAEVIFTEATRPGFEWIAVCDGFLPVKGIMDGEIRARGEDHVIQVDLQRGWGLDLQFLDEATEAPIAGVGVQCDGVSAGTSTADGLVELRLDRKPERLQLLGNGWHIPERNGMRGFFENVDFSLRIGRAIIRLAWNAGN